MGLTRIRSVNTGGGHRVQIDAGKDGSIVVLSTEAGEFLSRIDASGNQTVLTPWASYGNFSSGYVETLSDGRYVLYTTFHFGMGWDARIQVFNQDGTPASALIDPAFEDGANHLLSGYTLTPTNDGGFAFTWNDISRGSDANFVSYSPPSHQPWNTSFNAGTGYDVRLRYFDGNANATTGSSVADTDVESVLGASAARNASDQYLHDSATLTGGETVFAFVDTRWVGNPGGGAHVEQVLSVQISMPGDIGEPIQVDLGGFGEQFGQYPNTVDNTVGANVVALADGNFAVIWTETVYVPAAVWGNYQFDGWSTRIRYFDADGNALTDAIEIVRRGTDHGNHSRYVWGEALADGRIVIAYNEGVSGVNGNGSLDAFLGIIGPLGTSLDVERVNEQPAGNTQFYTIQDLAVRSDGTVDLVYNNAAPGQNGFNLNQTMIDQFTVDIPGVTITGTEANDVINPGRSVPGQPRPTAEADVIIGLGGNDRLDGGLGADRMEGRGGNDTYYVDDSGDQAVEELSPGVDAGGTDTVIATASYTLGAFIENLTLSGAGAIDGTGNGLNNRITGNAGINTLRGGEGNDSLNGNAGADTLYGNGGNDSLNGGTEADAMHGGSGNDSYTIDDAGDQAIEEISPGVDAGGTDSVRSSVTYTIGAFIENLTLTGLAAIDGTGNDLANRITGNAAANTLRGEGGNDALNGGLGADAMHGGSGNDSYTVDDSGDQVIEEASPGVDAGGTDSVRSSVSFTLGAFVENLTLTGSAALEGVGNDLNNRLTGNDGANVLRGGAGNDTLNGGLGADAMYGGSENDTYYVDNAGDQMSEEASPGVDAGGVDTVRSSVSFTLGNFVENLLLSGSDAIDGTGNELANRLTGNDGANTLRGGGANDVLSGGLGDDWLFGEAGLDTYTGGGGADRFVLDGPSGTSKDRIADFNRVEGDKIVIEGADYGFAAGALDPSAFATSAATTPGVGQFVYDAARKTLAWDADGTGGAAAVVIATFNSDVALNSADFLLI